MTPPVSCSPMQMWGHAGFASLQSLFTNATAVCLVNLSCICHRSMRLWCQHKKALVLLAEIWCSSFINTIFSVLFVSKPCWSAQNEPWHVKGKDSCKSSHFVTIYIESLWTPYHKSDLWTACFPVIDTSIKTRLFTLWHIDIFQEQFYHCCSVSPSHHLPMHCGRTHCLLLTYCWDIDLHGEGVNCILGSIVSE
jgi:hypothetical protein